MSANQRVSEEEFKLDTSNFDAVIIKSRNLAEKMGQLKEQLDNMKSDLVFSWEGNGRNTFEKKYRVLSQQFGDLKDDLMEISESLLEIEGEYIQLDTDSAKALDGKDYRY